MTMIRFNPMWEINNLMNEMGKFAKQNFTHENRPRVEIGGFQPRIDVLEDKDAIYFEAELPGVSKEDVKVSINDENLLTIKGNKKFEQDEEVKTCCRTERTFGEFSRSYQLADNFDTENIKANYENGILTLTVPKKEPVKPKEKEVTIS